MSHVLTPASVVYCIGWHLKFAAHFNLRSQVSYLFSVTLSQALSRIVVRLLSSTKCTTTLLFRFDFDVRVFLYVLIYFTAVCSLLIHFTFAYLTYHFTIHILWLICISICAHKRFVLNGIVSFHADFPFARLHLTSSTPGECTPHPAGIFLSVLIFLSVAGNILVCLAIYTERSLRRIGNLFLASLAIADLFVASLVMTFAGVNDLLGEYSQLLSKLF